MTLLGRIRKTYRSSLQRPRPHPAAVEELVQRVVLPDFEKSVELTKPFPKKWHDFLIETLADRL